MEAFPARTERHVRAGSPAERDFAHLVINDDAGRRSCAPPAEGEPASGNKAKDGRVHIGQESVVDELLREEIALLLRAFGGGDSFGTIGNLRGALASVETVRVPTANWQQRWCPRRYHITVYRWPVGLIS